MNKTKKVILFLVFSLLLLAGYENRRRIKNILYVAVNDFEHPNLKKIESNDVKVNYPYNERIWLHAVNTLHRLDYAKTKYPGIEVDVMYDVKNDYVDVGHWPEDTTKGPTFDEFIKSVSKSNIKIWIDFKNLRLLSHSETERAIDHILLIINRHNFSKELLIIESVDPERLHQFISKGFICSYWIPHIRERLVSANDIKDWYEEVATNIKKHQIPIISLDVMMLPLVMEYFPNVKHMVWGLNSNLTTILIDEVPSKPSRP